MDLKLAVYLQSYAAASEITPIAFLDQARAADAAGVDRVVVPDHVVFGERLDEYGKPERGGRAGGEQPTGPDGSYLDPITALAAVSSVTERVRLGTGILLAALRRPITLAKAVSTLDVLSNGRVDLGVGVGWQSEEYSAAGLAFEDRGRLLDESLEVAQLVWREQVASYRSENLVLEAIHMMPKPIQAGGVPIWISGTANSRVARRLARFGTGWIPWGDAEDDIGRGIVKMRELLHSLGTDGDHLRIVGRLPWRRDDDGAKNIEQTMAAIPSLAALGVTDFDLRFRFSGDFHTDVDELSSVVRAFRDVTR